MRLKAYIVIVMLSTTLADMSETMAQQAGILQNQTNGFFEVTYLVTGDTLHTDTFIPGNLVDPEIHVSVSVSDSEYAYTYDLTNRVGAHAFMGLFAFGVQVQSAIDSIASPNGEWTAGPMSENFAGYDAIDWAHVHGSGTGIPAGSTVSGFLLMSGGLPSISKAYGNSDSGVSWKEEGPTGAIRASFDSLEAATRFVSLLTIGPRDPPSPFNLGSFIDTLATYPSQAEDLGWIDSTTTVTDDLQTALDELSEDLAAGDSAHASGLIHRTLALVEAEKDSALTSEAYALFKYNLEYALDVVQ